MFKNKVKTCKPGHAYYENGEVNTIQVIFNDSEWFNVNLMSIVAKTMGIYKLHRTQYFKLFKSLVASDHVLTDIYVNMSGGLEQHRTQVFTPVRQKMKVCAAPIDIRIL